MLALRYEGPHKFSLVDIKTPVPGPKEVLIRVRSASICASDLKIFLGIKHATPGVILGHEVAGEIVDVGRGVEFYRPGMKVAIYPSVSCGRCYYCKNGMEHLCPKKKSIGYAYDGGFSEYLLLKREFVEARNLFVFDGIDFDSAALVEPLATVVNSLERVDIGDYVVIYGAGPMGLMHLVLIKYLYPNVKVVTVEKIAWRVQKALELGADFSGSFDEVRDYIMDDTGGRGASSLFLCYIDRKSLEQSFSLLSRRGRLLLFASSGSAIEVDVDRIHYGELVVTGSHSASRANFSRALDLIKRGLNLDTLITHRLRLEEFMRGLELVKNKEALKVVINP